MFVWTSLKPQPGYGYSPDMSGDFAETSSLEPSVIENVAIAEFDDFAKYISDVVNVLLPADDAGGAPNFPNILNEPSNKVRTSRYICPCIAG